MKIDPKHGALLLALCAAILITGAFDARSESIPCHLEPYSLYSGGHDGDGWKDHVAFRSVIRVDGAPWLQILFGDCDLGKGSYLTITSLEDGAVQRHHAESLEHYRYWSAGFNGDAVEVALHVSSGDKNVFFNVKEMLVGERAGDESGIKSICGADDRTSSTDPRVGRTRPFTNQANGTAWIISNGALLTAGHVDLGGCTLEFHVPASDCDGTINLPDPQHQYAVDTTDPYWGGKYKSWSGGSGDDWAIFECFPNSNTGLLPGTAQATAYRVSLDESPTTVRVTGFGTDMDPAGCGTGDSLYNADHLTQQTHSGPFVGEYHVPGTVKHELRYTVDTRGGNSGSPVIVNGTTVTVGIHTFGACPASGYNGGTGFKNDSLQAAIQIFPVFPAMNLVYVDKDHPVTTEDGTAFRPYDTISEGITAAPSGGTLCVVKGEYNSPATISKVMTIIAPTGTVTLAP